MGVSASANISDRCWKRHGRRRTERAKDYDAKDSLESRLLVTISLGTWFRFHMFDYLQALCFHLSRSLFILPLGVASFCV